MEIKKRVKLCVQFGNQIHYFQGEVIAETDSEITINDRKIGEVVVNKSNCITREVLNGA